MKAKYREEFAIRKISIKHARLTWQPYLSDGTDNTSIPKLRDQDALTKPAGPIIKTTVVQFVVLEARSQSVSTKLSDEKDWKVGDFVMVDEGEGVKVKHCLRGLQN